MEVFQVCNRIKGNLSLVNKFSQPEIDACLAIVMEIEHKHNFIQNIFRKCAITVSVSSRPFFFYLHFKFYYIFPI